MSLFYLIVLECHKLHKISILELKKGSNQIQEEAKRKISGNIMYVPRKPQNITLFLPKEKVYFFSKLLS